MNKNLISGNKINKIIKRFKKMVLISFSIGSRSVMLYWFIDVVISVSILRGVVIIIICVNLNIILVVDLKNFIVGLDVLLIFEVVILNKIVKKIMVSKLFFVIIFMIFVGMMFKIICLKFMILLVYWDNLLIFFLIRWERLRFILGFSKFINNRLIFNMMVVMILN